MDRIVRKLGLSGKGFGAREYETTAQDEQGSESDQGPSDDGDQQL